MRRKKLEPALARRRARAEGGVVVEHLELFVFVEHAFGDHVGDGEDGVVIFALVTVFETHPNGLGANFAEFL